MPASRSSRCLLVLAVASLVAACGEDPPPNETPTIVSSMLECGPSDDGNAGDVLVAGEVEVLDENLLSVRADVGGRAPIDLAADTLPEDADPLEVPQRWSFTLDASERVLCGETRVVTFTAIDEDGEQTTASAVALP